MICKYCDNAKCNLFTNDFAEARCIDMDSCPYRKPITNADRVRSMTDEELACFIRDQIIDRNIGIPTETWLEWLRME